MKISTLVSVIVILILALFVQGQSTKTSKEIIQELNNANISKNMASMGNQSLYHDLYKEEVNFGNIVQTGVYETLQYFGRMMNIIIPVTIEAGKGNASAIIIICVFTIAIFFIDIIIAIIQFLFLIYFFIKEKIHYKEKWYE